jgi:hypothetical protein
MGANLAKNSLIEAIKRGDVQGVEGALARRPQMVTEVFQLRNRPFNTTKGSVLSCTALCAAAVIGNEQVLARLWGKERSFLVADPGPAGGHTPYGKQVLRVLLDKGAQPWEEATLSFVFNRKPMSVRKTALALAASSGHAAATRLLIAQPPPGGNAELAQR